MVSSASPRAVRFVVSRSALTPPESLGNVGAHRVRGFSQLRDVKQTLPGPGVDHAIHFVPNEIGGFLDGNATRFHAAGYASLSELHHPFIAWPTIFATLCSPQ
jgi:hypothetical protein